MSEEKAKLPSILAVTQELKHINGFVDGECDVRLQVYPEAVNGKYVWAVRWGLPDYDLDHRGWWGAATIAGGGKRIRDLRSTAVNLLRQVEDEKFDDELDCGAEHHGN